MPSLFISIKQEEIPFSEAKSLSDIKGVSVNQNYIQAEFIANEVAVPAQNIVGPKIDAPQVAIDGFYKKFPLQQGYEIAKNEANYIATKQQQTLTTQQVAVQTTEKLIEEISKAWKETLDVLPLLLTRPIHSISVFLDGKPIQHKYTYNPISFKEVNKIEILQNGIGIELINEEIARIEKEYGITCVSRQSVEELAWLYEKPQFAESKIPQEYLSLPKEVLNLTIAKNQRYILFEKAGEIVPQFLIVGKRHSALILKGHLKTLTARLDDARYYIEKDIKTFPINGISPLLEKIAFHQKYGSVAKRVHEMQVLAQKLFQNNSNLKQAILVCKNDLCTNIVQSFTELQGYCGGYYLQQLGIETEISTAVAQHYKPLSPKGDLPSTLLGKMLSIVDKLHKVNTLAEVGEIPTSSRDPFAIRRDILSIIRICVAEKIDFPSTLIHEKLQGFVQERVKLFVKEYMDSSELVLQNFDKYKNFGKIV